MKTIDKILPNIRCLECYKGNLNFDYDSNTLVCNNCCETYSVIHGRPILLRRDNEVFHPEKYLNLLSLDSSTNFKSTMRSFVPSPSLNLSSARLIKQLHQNLRNIDNLKVLVVGSGLQRLWLDKVFAENDNETIVYTDIDQSAIVDIFCDGHDLPFFDSTFDALITTAVLEHVLYPERVANEIHRVLKTGGILYSEIPFMQQVHEGAYDFTRYTLSGHRRLHNKFQELESGMVAGPSTAFVWAFENLVLSFVRHNSIRTFIKILMRLSISWIKYIDVFLKNRPEAMDGASCTYFLGHKAEKNVPDSHIISNYTGANLVKH